jgi:SAM-dependent methyltransferase
MEPTKLDQFLEKGFDTTAPPNRLFGETDDNFWYLLNTEGYRRSPTLRRILPSMPDEEVQIQITGSAGDTVLGEGFTIYRLFKRLFEQYVGELTTCTKCLDFGCGWGRVIRFFLKDLEPSQLVGTDANPFLIDICRSTNHWCSFNVNNRLPPISSFAESTFELIYCFSVFSHLPEDVHEKWLTELHRILRPGGLLIATTWPRNFIERCDAARRNEEFAYLPNRHSEGNFKWKNRLASHFEDTQEALERYDDGNLCFAEYNRQQEPWAFLEGRPYWGEACIPRSYVLDRWTKHYTFVDYINDRDQCSQNVIVMKK